MSNETEQTRREAVEKYVASLETMRARDAAAQTGFSYDTIIKWGKKMNIKTSRRGRKPKSKSAAASAPTPSSSAVVAGRVKATTTPSVKEGKVMVLVGDPESVRSILQTVYNVTH